MNTSYVLKVESQNFFMILQTMKRNKQFKMWVEKS